MGVEKKREMKPSNNVLNANWLGIVEGNVQKMIWKEVCEKEGIEIVDIKKRNTITSFFSLGNSLKVIFKYKGKYYGIEVKKPKTETPKGSLSSNQKARIAEIERSGGVVGVAYSVVDVEKLLQIWGIS